MIPILFSMMGLLGVLLIKEKGKKEQKMLNAS